MYSATVWTDPKLYASHFKAIVDNEKFLRTFSQRAAGERVCIPVEMDQAFLETHERDLEPIRDLVTVYRLAQLRAADAKIASQSARLVDAERRLAVKPSKAAGHGARMVKQKVASAQRRREALAQGSDRPQFGRIFPGSFVPVVTKQDAQLVVLQMRYKCLPNHLDSRQASLLESLHHARRDTLGGRWQREFGHTHAVIAVESLFESVALHRLRQRDLSPGERLATLELEFFPAPEQTLYVPCLWSHWQRAGQLDFRSFAMVIDRAPPEVQSAGQEWSPVTIKREHVASWLNPDPSNLAACYAILDDRPSVRLDNLPSSTERARLARPAPTKIINLWKPLSADTAFVA